MSYMAYHEQKQEQERKLVAISAGEKTMTIEELANYICTFQDACSEDCPGWDYCKKGQNGVLEWLRKVIADGD